MAESVGEIIEMDANPSIENRPLPFLEEDNDESDPVSEHDPALLMNPGDMAAEHVISADSVERERGFNCAVCMEVMVPPILLGCQLRHNLCYECWYKTAENGNNFRNDYVKCPLCRMEFTLREWFSCGIDTLLQREIQNTIEPSRFEELRFRSQTFFDSCQEKIREVCERDQLQALLRPFHFRPELAGVPLIRPRPPAAPVIMNPPMFLPNFNVNPIPQNNPPIVPPRELAGNLSMAQLIGLILSKINPYIGAARISILFIFEAAFLFLTLFFAYKITTFPDLISDSLSIGLAMNFVVMILCFAAYIYAMKSTQVNADAFKPVADAMNQTMRVPRPQAQALHRQYGINNNWFNNIDQPQNRLPFDIIPQIEMQGIINRRRI